MRHKGTSILVASQDPPSVPVPLIELSSQVILHKFNSPAWLKHLQKANARERLLAADLRAALGAGLLHLPRALSLLIAFALLEGHVIGTVSRYAGEKGPRSWVPPVRRWPRTQHQRRRQHNGFPRQDLKHHNEAMNSQFGRGQTMDWRERDVREAKATRERLEKGSPSAERRNFAGMLNALVSESASREMPGLVALEAIRKGQRLGYKSASDHTRIYERLEKAGFAENFNRLRPASGAAGSLASSDARARDHWPTGETGAIEPEFLLDVARALIEAVRARTMRFPEGTRD
jgi:hypothetical protein